MLHGFGDTGDMWAPVAAVLIPNHTVVVPDLRGMGLSSHPQGGYEKKTLARDIAQVMDKLNIVRPVSSRTISAIWSAMRSPRNFPRA